MAILWGGGLLIDTCQPLDQRLLATLSFPNQLHDGGGALGKFTAHVVPLSFNVPPGKRGGVPTCTPSWPQDRPQSGWSPWSL